MQHMGYEGGGGGRGSGVFCQTINELRQGLRRHGSQDSNNMFSILNHMFSILCSDNLLFCDTVHYRKCNFPSIALMRNPYPCQK